MYTDEEWDRRIDQAAERAVGVYYQKTRHDIGLVLEDTVYHD